MICNYMSDYQKRVLRGANTLRELETIRAKDDFDRYMKTSPSVKMRYVTDVDEPCITEKTKQVPIALVDFTENDAKALDEKIIYTYPDVNIDVGCYIRAEGFDWLVTFEEYDPLGIKKHFIIRRCNNFMTIPYKGELYKIPISIENLTMYSDGVADYIYLSYMDSKKQIWYGSNPVTRTITENFRILLTHRTAFRITHINDFEYVGLIKSLVLQTAMYDGDNTEINMADNTLYNKRNYLDDTLSPVSPVTNKIRGDGKFIVGEEKEFLYSTSDINIPIRWRLSDYKAFEIKAQSDENVVISSKMDNALIGHKTKLEVINAKTEDVIDSITLMLRR